MLSLRRTRGIAILALAALLVAAAATYAFSPNEAPVPAPLGIPEWAVGAEHLSITDSYPSQPSDFDRSVSRSDLVARGVITEVMASRWATPSGAAPDDLGSYESLKAGSGQIRTPVVFAVNEAYKGGVPDDDMLVFSYEGGRVGDTVQVVDNNHDIFAKGNQLIVFLSRGGPDNPASHVSNSGLYPRLQLVVEGDVARGSKRDVPLQGVLQQLDK